MDLLSYSSLPQRATVLDDSELVPVATGDGYTRPPTPPQPIFSLPVPSRAPPPAAPETNSGASDTSTPVVSKHAQVSPGPPGGPTQPSLAQPWPSVATTTTTTTTSTTVTTFTSGAMRYSHSVGPLTVKFGPPVLPAPRPMAPIKIEVLDHSYPSTTPSAAAIQPVDVEAPEFANSHKRPVGRPKGSGGGGAQRKRARSTGNGPIATIAPSAKQKGEVRTGMRAQALQQLTRVDFSRPIRVPEYDQLLEYMDEELGVRDLNEPEDVGLRDVEKMESTLAKQLAREGIQPEAIDEDWEKRKWRNGTYINCDLRYFNLSALGKFDVVLIDPPWRLRGIQTSGDERTMFNNSRFALRYNTMSTQEIMDLDVGALSDRGFIFLWTINSQMQNAFECLNKWGYTYIDRLVWLKKTPNGNVSISQGFYFLHSTEICLLGVKKNPDGRFLEFMQKVSNDMIFAQMRKRSQKPEQLYILIERMLPGSRKIELFGRNHNIRPGWLTVGNQLGELYNWEYNIATCDSCKLNIRFGEARFKHKFNANSDFCKKCWKMTEDDENCYFKLVNPTDEMVFHDYFECVGCKARPLWGVRFCCEQCVDYNLCEDCYDKKEIPEEQREKHLAEHTFRAVEVPELAGGLPIHRQRCDGCEAFPIVGYRFKCVDCTNTSFCQKCFFQKKEALQAYKNHNKDFHRYEVIVDSQRVHMASKCDICGMKPIVGMRYKCDSCFNFDICESCYLAKRPAPRNRVSHRATHIFTKIAGDKELEDYSGPYESGQFPDEKIIFMPRPKVPVRNKASSTIPQAPTAAGADPGVEILGATAAPPPPKRRGRKRKEPTPSPATLPSGTPSQPAVVDLEEPMVVEQAPMTVDDLFQPIARPTPPSGVVHVPVPPGGPIAAATSAPYHVTTPGSLNPSTVVPPEPQSPSKRRKITSPVLVPALPTKFRLTLPKQPLTPTIPSTPSSAAASRLHQDHIGRSQPSTPVSNPSAPGPSLQVPPSPGGPRAPPPSPSHPPPYALASPRLRLPTSAWNPMADLFFDDGQDISQSDDEDMDEEDESDSRSAPGNVQWHNWQPGQPPTAGRPLDTSSSDDDSDLDNIDYVE